MKPKIVFDADMHADRSKRGSTFKAPDGTVLIIVEPLKGGDVVCIKPSGDFCIRRWGALMKYKYMGWEKMTMTVEREEFHRAVG